MKRFVFASLVSLFMLQPVFSQLQAEFQYTLVVEDARGKKDSVVIGYDQRAQSFKLDIVFGEVDQLKIDVRDLNQGLYLLKFKTNENQMYMSKFSKS